MSLHKIEQQLLAGLDHIRNSPRDGGVVEMIVIAPQSDERRELKQCALSFAGGVHGDKWAKGCWKSLPDGSPHPWAF